MTVPFGAVVLVILGPTKSLCASSPIQSFERNSTGVTLYSDIGAVRVDVCSDRIIHVVASPPQKLSPAIVPAVIHPCHDSIFKVEWNKSTVAIRTAALEISIDRGTGALRFLSGDGKSVLSEPGDGGRTLTQITIDGTPTFLVQQDSENRFGIGRSGVFAGSRTGTAGAPGVEGRVEMRLRARLRSQDGARPWSQKRFPRIGRRF